MICINFLCALRSGGDFNTDDVDRLKDQVERGFSDRVNINFMPLVDVKGYPGGIKLQHKWPGWWSLIEVFRFRGPAIMMGLDTVIVGNLDPLAEMVSRMPEDEFAMLRPFNPDRNHGRWASGITMWNGDWRWLYDDFWKSADDNMATYVMEQKYTSAKLEQRGVEVREIQDYVDGIYSYKRHCRDGLPEDARVVLFHGDPRPSQVVGVSWIEENYACAQ